MRDFLDRLVVGGGRNTYYLSYKFVLILASLLLLLTILILVVIYLIKGKSKLSSHLSEELSLSNDLSSDLTRLDDNTEDQDDEQEQHFSLNKLQSQLTKSPSILTSSRSLVSEMSVQTSPYSVVVTLVNEQQQHPSPMSTRYHINLANISTNGLFIIMPSISNEEFHIRSNKSAIDVDLPVVNVAFTMNLEQQKFFLNYYGREKNPILKAKMAYKKRQLKKKSLLKKKQRLKFSSSSGSFSSTDAIVPDSSLNVVKGQIEQYLANPQLNLVEYKQDESGGLGSSVTLMELRRLKYFFANEKKSLINFYLYDLKPSQNQQKQELKSKRSTSSVCYSSISLTRDDNRAINRNNGFAGLAGSTTANAEEFDSNRLSAFVNK
jgi:hypothetical protein